MARLLERKRAGIVWFIARLGAAYLALTVGALLLGPRAAAPLLPVLEVGLEQTHPQFEVRSLTVEADRLHLEANLIRYSPGRGVYRRVPLVLYLPSLQLLASPILALALLLAWPHPSRRAGLFALVLALPLIALVEVLDAPFAFAAAVAEKLAAPGQAPRGLGDFWWFFLDNGGRQLLALLVAPVAVAAAGHLQPRRWSSKPRPEQAGSKSRSPRSRPDRSATAPFPGSTS